MDQRTPVETRPEGGDGPSKEEEEQRLDTLEGEVEELKQRTPRVPADHQDCGCARAFRMTQEHHDWLTSFEERGVTGVVELIAQLQPFGRRGGRRRHTDVDRPGVLRRHALLDQPGRRPRPWAFHVVTALSNQRRAANAIATLRTLASTVQEGLASLDHSPLAEAAAR